MSAGPVPVLRDVVAQEVAAWRALGASPGAWLTGELLVRWGITFKPAPLPAKIERGVPRACFYNARKLVARRRGTLRYAEGLAMAPSLPLPVAHGWAVTDDGTVIDPTWSEPEACQYLGIAFEPDMVRRWDQKAVACLLSTETSVRWELIFAIDRT